MNLCEHIIHYGSYIDPLEYCPEPAEPGEAYCLGHLPDRDFDPDGEWKERLFR